MLKGLSSSWIGEAGTLKQFAVLASRYGFQSIEAGGEEIRTWLRLDGLTKVRHTLAELSIKISSSDCLWNEDNLRSSLYKDFVNCPKMRKAARSIGCTSCCTYVLPSTDYPSARFMILETRLRPEF
ncbi:hypothetical protein [Paenibacillus larvae]|uniref:hypothetical protein n=1 Tax=Paenibacillus larvae TaxID=1464 RepID=UPI001F1B1D69|nr:hypothetical protein [Paenibacillus larvae]